jgi:hypothetical protein
MNKALTKDTISTVEWLSADEGILKTIEDI